MSEENDAIVSEEVEVEVLEVETESTEVETTDAEELVEETEPNEADSDTPDPSPEKEKGIQARIDELTRIRRETERDRDYWKAQATAQPQPKPEIKLETKTLSDFDYDEAAYQAHVVETAQQAALNQVNSIRQQQEFSTQNSAFEEREAKYAKEHDDYYAATRQNVRLSVTDEMASVIRTSDIGPQLFHHLGSNPDVADRLARMPKSQMNREMGKLEARLEAKPVTSKVSNAPAPPPKIKAVAPSTRVKPDSPESDKLSTEKWLKSRNKQIYG